MSTHPMEWPSLTEYTDACLAQVAFPLGGIGTGTIGLGGRADLRDFEICNRPDKGFTPPWSFFALRVGAPGREPVVRVLEGPIRRPFDGSHGVMLATKHVPRHPMLCASGAGLPRMAEVRLRAAYPFATFEFSDPDLPVGVRLEAFNPLIPRDVQRSGLPIAMLRYVIDNPGDQPIDIAIAGSLYNFIGRHHGSDGTATFLGGNVNEARQTNRADGTQLHGLLMRSNHVPRRTPEDGTMALAVLAGEATMRTAWGTMQWSRNLQSFWEDFAEDGRLQDEGPAATPSPRGEGQSGSIATNCRIDARSTRSVTFLLAWHFPHRCIPENSWGAPDEGDGWIGNAYAQPYADAWDVIDQTAPHLDTLEADSLFFVRTLLDSTLPQSVKEAALNNISTLRSETCFRTANGDFYAFEGCWDDEGCCPGSCTHVWNYEQVTPFLFPELARSMRRIELEQGTLANGLNCFRVTLPAGAPPRPSAAADGQMGVVMKCYRDWQLNGDTDFLRTHWPTIRSLLEFCWLPGGWDADRDGVMEGIQHNTSDIEFFGPNPLCSVWYLGALRAAEEMAQAVGDETFSNTCRDLFTRGGRWIDEHLFNGEYYIQQIQLPIAQKDTPDGLRLGLGARDLRNPEFQVGNGCLSDQLVGQYMAHIADLGHLLDPAHIRSALRAIFRHNFRATMHDHWNPLRAFALEEESALVVCTWPHNDAPAAPFFRAYEVWTGVEYQVAAHAIYEGLVDEGVTLANAIRARFDGARRNPWNEQECGHHYARAMAAWALVTALSGFHYSAPAGTLTLAPRSSALAFRTVWSVPAAWGSVEQRITNRDQRVVWRIHDGEISVRTVRLQLPLGQSVESIDASMGAHTLNPSFTQNGRHLTVNLASEITLSTDQPLLIAIALTAKTDAAA